MMAVHRLNKAAWRLANEGRNPFSKENRKPEYEEIRPILGQMLKRRLITDAAIEKISRDRFDLIRRENFT